MTDKTSDIDSGENLNRTFFSLTGINILSNLTIPLQGLVDTAFLGHLDEIRFLGGVALATVIFDYLYWGLGFLRMGTTGLIAQTSGISAPAERQPVLAEILWRGVVLAVIMGFSILLLQDVIRDTGFYLSAGEASLKAAGIDYFDHAVTGAPAVLLNFVLLGYWIGLGKSGVALAMTVVANLGNAGLDYVFIVEYGMAAAGAGLATMLSQYASLVTGTLFLIGTGHLKPPSYERLFQKKEWGALLKLNNNILIRTMSLITSFAVFINGSATLGTGFLVANTIIHKIITGAAYLTDGIAYAVETLAGRLWSQGKYDAMRGIVRLATVCSYVFIAVFLVFTTGFAEDVFGLLSKHQAIIELAVIYSVWMIPYLGFAVGAYVLDGVFIGLTWGDKLRNSMLFSTLVCFAPVAAAAFYFGDNHWFWGAMTAFAAGRLFSLWYIYRSQLRRLIN